MALINHPSPEGGGATPEPQGVDTYRQFKEQTGFSPVYGGFVSFPNAFWACREAETPLRPSEAHRGVLSHAPPLSDQQQHQ